MTLGNKIRLKRQEGKLTQLELARMIGERSSVIISNWEKGKREPSAEKLILLCNALKCSPNYFYDVYDKFGIQNSTEENMLSDFRMLDEVGKGTVLNCIQYQKDRCKNG